MHLPCVAFHTFGVEILKILFFGKLIATKLPKSSDTIAKLSKIFKIATPNLWNATQGMFIAILSL